MREAEEEKRAGLPRGDRGGDRGGEAEGPHLTAHGREQALLASQKRTAGRTAQERDGVKTGTASRPGRSGRCVTVSRSLRILAHEASVEGADQKQIPGQSKPEQKAREELLRTDQSFREGRGRGH